MNLFIRIDNGVPVNHPIFEDNFKAVYPEIDTENLPQEFMKFERIPAPDVGPYEVLEGPTYQIVGDVVKDIWNIRMMTPTEKEEKIQMCKSKNKPFDSWVFSEELCAYVSPIPHPTDLTHEYAWRESDTRWVILPPPPLPEAGEVYALIMETGEDTARWEKL